MPVKNPLRSGSGRLANAARGHSRLVGAGVAAAFAALAAIVATRRHGTEMVTLPDPAGRATETAVSVHNAAKSTMLSAARTADAPDLALITRIAQEAIADAIEAGVDLVPVAIGVAGSLRHRPVGGKVGSSTTTVSPGHRYLPVPPPPLSPGRPHRRAPAPVGADRAMPAQDLPGVGHRVDAHVEMGGQGPHGGEPITVGDLTVADQRADGAGRSLR